MSDEKRTLRAVAYPDPSNAPYWLVSIPEVDGMTQAADAEDAKVMAADYVESLLELPAGSVTIDLEVRGS